MAASWIDRINQENGRLYKEKVLTEAEMMAELGSQAAERFLSGLRYAYDPMVVFGVKKVDDTVGLVDRENPWEEFFNILNRLRTKPLSGNAARDAITKVSQQFDSEEWNKFCAPIIRKDLRIGVTETTINKVLKNKKYRIPIFNCQLATDITGRSEIKGKVRLEPKYDGIRALVCLNIADIVYSSLTKQFTVYSTVYSRNGKKLPNFNKIQRELEKYGREIERVMPSNFANWFLLDGEIVSNSFQDLMRQVHRKKNVDTSDSIFYIFDIIPATNFTEGYWNAPLYKRLEYLERLRPIIANSSNLKIVSGEEVDLDTDEGWEKYHAYTEKAIQAGSEGIMIKKLGAPYQCKRTDFWLKHKPTITVDLKVIGVEEGTGRNKGRLGALICHGIDNNREITVNVGSGFTDKERQEIWDNQNHIIGSIVEVLADSVTQNQDGTCSLRFPRFVRFRDDK